MTNQPTRKPTPTGIRKTDIDDMSSYRNELAEGRSRVAAIISSESIKETGNRIREAVVETIVNNGHGVMLKRG
jgi:hypothetical protein